MERGRGSRSLYGLHLFAPQTNALSAYVPSLCPLLLLVCSLSSLCSIVIRSTPMQLCTPNICTQTAFTPSPYAPQAPFPFDPPPVCFTSIYSTSMCFTSIFDIQLTGILSSIVLFVHSRLSSIPLPWIRTLPEHPVEQDYIAQHTRITKRAQSCW